MLKSPKLLDYIGEKLPGVLKRPLLAEHITEHILFKYYIR